MKLFGVSKIKVLLNFLLILFFFGAIYSSFLFFVFSKPKELNFVEKRKFAPKPVFSQTTSIKDYINKFEAYFKDHFGFRDEFIFVYSYVKYSVFKMSPSNQVLVGKDGWLFFTSESILTDWKGVSPFTSAEIKKWRAVIESRKRLADKLSIKYIVVVIPSNLEIYPEKLPSYLGTRAKETRIDQFFKAMNTEPKLPSLDLREALLKVKEKWGIWNKLDSHWAAWGAYYGYVEIVSKFLEPHLGIHALKETDIAMTKEEQSGDLARLINLEGSLKNIVPVLDNSNADFKDRDPVRYKEHTQSRVTIHKNKKLPRALIFRDSFGEQLIPYLSQHFSEVVYLWSFGYLNEAEIKEIKPDVIMEIHTQRWFNKIDPDDIDPVEI